MAKDETGGLKDMLRKIASDIEDGENGGFKSKIEASELLTKYHAHKIDFEVGDFVEQRECYQRYTFPKGNQVAMCVHIFDGPQVDDDEDITDIIIAVAVGKDRVKEFTVNSKFYKKK